MLGIALEGGGAKGAYQIGVWKYLKEKDIKIQGIVGTSIGATNGALMAMGDLEFAVNIWENLFEGNKTNKDFNIKDIPEEFNTEKIDDIDEFYKIFINKKDGLDIIPMMNFIKDNIDEELIRNKDLDFGLVTYNLSKKALKEIFLEDIKKDSLYKYVLASSYLPIFKAMKIDGDYYIDGGFFNKLPINMLVNKGYKKIISVRLRPDRYDYSRYKNVDIIDISPKKVLGGTLDFDRERILENIELGYKDAKYKLSDTVDTFIG